MRWKAVSPVLLGSVLVLAAAACGGGGSGAEHFTLATTTRCLEQKPLAYGVSRKVDFVASTASGGAAHVQLPDNDVTVLFGSGPDEAANLADAYRRFRAENVGIEDILRTSNNAVLLWRLHPSQGDELNVANCLK